jgi:hypothetical protein
MDSVDWLSVADAAIISGIVCLLAVIVLSVLVAAKK